MPRYVGPTDWLHCPCGGLKPRPMPGAPAKPMPTETQLRVVRRLLTALEREDFSTSEQDKALRVILQHFGVADL